MQILETILTNKEAMSAFLTEHVARTIRFWVEYLSANAHTWATMFRVRTEQFHPSGTPYNKGCYPSFLELVPEPGTLGEAVDIVSKKCLRIDELKATEASKILDEDLETYFKMADTNATAILDGPGFLKGLLPKQVAQRMADFCKIHRPDISVITFPEDDKWVVLNIADGRITPHKNCSAPRSKPDSPISPQATVSDKISLKKQTASPSSTSINSPKPTKSCNGSSASEASKNGRKFLDPNNQLDFESNNKPSSPCARSTAKPSSDSIPLISPTHQTHHAA